MRILLSVCLAILATGCATAPASKPKDPFEGFNRSVYEFNETLDQAVVKPVAQTYQQITPQPVRTGVKNFFGNLSDVWSTVNNALQLKPAQTAESFLRVLINSTVGLYGVLDIATELKLERHSEDFGQTLGYWGVPDGPYVVLPFLGPSTLRDTAGLPVDTSTDVVRNLDHVPTRNSALALRIVEKRADLLKTTELLGEASLDKYSFTRDAYLQYRRSQIYDGNPPDTSDDAAEPSSR